MKENASSEDSEESDIDLNLSEKNRMLNTLGKAKNIIKMDDCRVGDLKDHLEEVQLVLRKVRSNIAKDM